MPATSTYDLSGDAYINGLLGDVKWATNRLTFSFPTDASFYGSGYGAGEPTQNFKPLNGKQQAVVHDALDMYASVANLTFNVVTKTSAQHGDLRFAMSDKPSTAWAYFPSTAAEGGDSWFNGAKGYYDNPVKGNYAHTTFLHEIGHALGLEHAHEHHAMPTDRDSMEYTVMSYRSYVGASATSGYTNEAWGYAQSLMMYDIAALQHMYGANYTTNGGNTTYLWSPRTGEMSINGVSQGAPGANRIFMTVWDGGGIDTYDFSQYSTNLNVDLRPGNWTTTSSEQLAKLHYDGSQVAAGNIANALLHKGDQRSLIENAKGGAGNDVIIGNSAANTLWGDAGNDHLQGGDGNDTLVGGRGADRLDGGAGLDRVLYSGAAATNSQTGTGLIVDLLTPHLNTGEAAGDTYVSIERVHGSRFHDDLRGDNASNVIWGGAGDDIIYGRGGNDTLYGNDGNDRIIGGAGADILFGGAGADVFVFASLGDSGRNARDTIRDFTAGIDRIDLSGIDANINVSGDQAFRYIGGNSFTGTAGQLNFQSGVVSGDVDGDRIADFQINVAAVTSLFVSDFIL